MKGVRVGDSSLGQGVFATRHFYAKETVGRVEGATIRDPGYGSEYCMELDSIHSLEPEAPFRFLNHSCQPNCELVVVEAEEVSDGSPKAEDAPTLWVASEVWVEALTSIEPGDQLTIDYAWPFEEAIPCQCGSPKCRGWIVDADQLDQLRQSFRT